MLNYTNKVQADILPWRNGENPAHDLPLEIHALCCSALKAHVAFTRRAFSTALGKKSTGKRFPRNGFCGGACVSARRVSRNCARELRRALIGPPLCARASKRVAEDFFLVRGFPGKAVPVTRKGYVLNHILSALKSVAKHSSCLAHGVFEY